MMKKTLTFYFLFLACLSGFFAHSMKVAAGLLRRGMWVILEGKPLPQFTDFALDYHWWPWAFVLIYSLCAIGSLVHKSWERFFIHVLVCLLLVEIWMMFMEVSALVLPWITLAGS